MNENSLVISSLWTLLMTKIYIMVIWANYLFEVNVKIHSYSSTAEAIKIITKISEIQALILSSQLKEMLKRLNFQDNSQAMNNNNNNWPIRIVYHPSEPFYVFRQVWFPFVVFYVPVWVESNINHTHSVACLELI